jgi:hypothetical protein
MQYTEREKELLTALVSTMKALGRLIDQTQPAEHEHPELDVLEKAFEVVGNHSDTNQF